MGPFLLKRLSHLKTSWPRIIKSAGQPSAAPLTGLEAMGLIIRRQGVGTFVRKSSNISNLLNQFIDFPRLIADNGFEPGYQQLRTELIAPDARPGFKVSSLTRNDRLLEIEKVFLADGDPIIYCINHIPEWVFQGSLSR